MTNAEARYWRSVAARLCGDDVTMRWPEESAVKRITATGLGEMYPRRDPEHAIMACCLLAAMAEDDERAATRRRTP